MNAGVRSRYLEDRGYSPSFGKIGESCPERERERKSSRHCIYDLISGITCDPDKDSLVPVPLWSMPGIASA